ncbi:MAG: hypothetical protein A49_19260 [Methyloceanibacter sp.]|nr:MAG: hypothetical protein A49_19260 [Methyloceanibacter sp.]
MIDLLQNETARHEMYSRAEERVTAMSGALPKTQDAIDAYLPDKVPLQHAS